MVLSSDEVVRFLEAVPSLKTRTALTTAYGAGLRASETVGLKVKNIDSARGVIRIEHGKGGKDRYVMLSHQLLRVLRVYWRLTRPREWLFPGRTESKPIDVQVLPPRLLGLPVGTRCGRYRQACDGGIRYDTASLLTRPAGRHALRPVSTSV